MIQRELNPLKTSSFFLFGARGTGKSTFLSEQFGAKNPLWIDLLNPNEEDRFSRNPMLLELEVLSLFEKKQKFDWIVIDEVQKIPTLLNVIHRLIEKHGLKFAITGSSARKLKRGHANLLGGRASIYVLYPFSYFELEQVKAFNLDSALQWGTLPRIHRMHEEREKITALRGYVQTYLKEEVLIEQLVRNLVPFKGFLEVSAQMNGKKLNFEKIARDIGVDNKTVQSYFDILEETYLGARLPTFHRSVRKSQLLQSKFYWFDLGVQRFLNGTIHSKLIPSTGAYGDAFEAFIINEIIRFNSYHELDYKFSYLQTKHGAEVDLILTRGKENIAIEIKSSLKVDLVEVHAFESLALDIPGVKRLFYISQDPRELKVGKVECLHWGSFFKDFKDI